MEYPHIHESRFLLQPSEWISFTLTVRYRHGSRVLYMGGLWVNFTWVPSSWILSERIITERCGISKHQLNSKRPWGGPAFTDWLGGGGARAPFSDVFDWTIFGFDNLLLWILSPLQLNTLLICTTPVFQCPYPYFSVWGLYCRVVGTMFCASFRV